MFEFVIEKLNKLGDYSETYGQRYWGSATSETAPISFNSQNQNINAGDRIEAEEKVMKKSQKGTTYWQLRKVKVVESSAAENSSEGSQNAPQGQVRQSSIYEPPSYVMDELKEILIRIEEKIDKLLGSDSEKIPEEFQ